MTTTNEDLAAVVSDAEQEAAEAEQLFAALEEKVKAGDLKVSAAQIETQRGVSRFARLRVEAARRKAERARQDDPGDYGHHHTPRGVHLTLVVLQDILEVPCESCGKRTQGQYDSSQGWAHDPGCTAYAPHPSSIAGIASQARGV